MFLCACDVVNSHKAGQISSTCDSRLYYVGVRLGGGGVAKPGSEVVAFLASKYNNLCIFRCSISFYEVQWRHTASGVIGVWSKLWDTTS